MKAAVGLGIRRTRFGPQHSHILGQNLLVILDLFLSFQISLVTKSKRFFSRSQQSVLSAAATALFPVFSAFHLDTCISLLKNILSPPSRPVPFPEIASGVVPLHLVKLAAASEPWEDVRSQPSTQYLSLWPCGIIYREAFSYCYALDYFLVCSQRLLPAIFVSLYCREAHSQAPLTKGFWPNRSMGSTAGRWWVWEKADPRVPLSVCATAGVSSPIPPAHSESIFPLLLFIWVPHSPLFCFTAV